MVVVAIYLCVVLGELDKEFNFYWFYYLPFQGDKILLLAATDDRRIDNPNILLPITL